MNNRLFWKRILAILFLFFSSCSSKGPSWSYTCDTKSEKQFHSAQMTLNTEKLYGGIDAVLVKGSTGTRMYFNVNSIEIQPVESNSTVAEVIIIIDGNEDNIFAHRFEGGQRVLIPERNTQGILNALSQGKEVNITMGRYNDTIVPNHFGKNYHKFNQTLHKK